MGAEVLAALVIIFAAGLLVGFIMGHDSNNGPHHGMWGQQGQFWPQNQGGYAYQGQDGEVISPANPVSPLGRGAESNSSTSSSHGKASSGGVTTIQGTTRNQTLVVPSTTTTP